MVTALVTLIYKKVNFHPFRGKLLRWVFLVSEVTRAIYSDGCRSLGDILSRNDCTQRDVLATMLKDEVEIRQRDVVATMYSQKDEVTTMQWTEMAKIQRDVEAAMQRYVGGTMQKNQQKDPNSNRVVKSLEEPTSGLHWDTQIQSTLNLIQSVFGSNFVNINQYIIKCIIQTKKLTRFQCRLTIMYLVNYGSPTSYSYDFGIYVLWWSTHCTNLYF